MRKFSVCFMVGDVAFTSTAYSSVGAYDAVKAVVAIETARCSSLVPDLVEIMQTLYLMQHEHQNVYQNGNLTITAENYTR